ncbi:MAG: SPOR domain-containing protein [Azonexus sp.]|jgi:DedD protein|nr:SPOR domain-containing protein [Azonexus sp.]
MEDNDAQLQLKKRARRRLVGALAFVSVVAVVLPLVMDQEPRQATQDVEIRIPGQDEKTFAPRLSREPVESAKPPARPPTEETPAAKPEAQPNARVVETVRRPDDDKPAEKPAARPVEKPPAKPAEKPPAKPAEKPPEKPAAKPPEKSDEARRAAAILAGQSVAPPAASGEYLILIGAFADEANVKNLQTKLGEQGVKVITEPLATPQGKKTRVRAGPFSSREAADKALAKMQKIGVSGVVAPRQ